MNDVKSMLPIKAAPLDMDEEAAWFAGRVPRRLLAIPFGGPIPSPKSRLGVDLDGEFFSERTDIFGAFPELRRTRERLTDFHHSARPPGPGYGDPTGMMKGVFIGKSILDTEPDEHGWWVDFWFKQGDSRVKLIEQLARRGAQLYGSSQPLAKADIAEDGEILTWPFWLETISTAPQNTFSVIRPKAALEAVAGDPFWADMATELHDLQAYLPGTSAMGDPAAKSGRMLSASNEAALREALAVLEKAFGTVRTVLDRQPDYSGRAAEQVDQ